MKKLSTTLLAALVSLGPLTACASSDAPTGTESSTPASPTAIGSMNEMEDDRALFLAAELWGEWTSTNDSGERTVVEFHQDGTCNDYAPDYEDPTYGRYQNCTWGVRFKDQSLVIDYTGDDGDPTKDVFKWTEAGMWMEWHLYGDTLKWDASVYTRTG